MSADQEVAAIFGASADDNDVDRPKLIRQNTFTKDSESSIQAFASTASASKKSSKVFQNKSEVRLVGGSLVKKNAELEAFDYKDLRASVRKPSDNLQVEGAVDYSKQDWAVAGKVERRSIQANQSSIDLQHSSSSTSLVAKKSVSGKQKAVRKRTWTKEER